MKLLFLTCLKQFSICSRLVDFTVPHGIKITSFIEPIRNFVKCRYEQNEYDKSSCSSYVYLRAHSDFVPLPQTLEQIRLDIWLQDSNKRTTVRQSYVTQNSFAYVGKNINFNDIEIFASQKLRKKL
jgi:hypothetical protein